MGLRVKDLFANLLGTTWGFEVFIVVTVTLALRLALRYVIRHLKKLAELSKNPWDDALVDAARLPLGWMILGAGVLIALDIAVVATGSELAAYVDSLLELWIVVMLAWFAVRLIARMEAHFAGKSRQDDDAGATTAHAIAKLLRASVIITATIIAMQTLGFSITSILAFGGVGGIAVGFAARDLLANFFGAAIVFFDRPFSVGDWIRSPDSEIEGTVEDIGWRVTRVRTFDQRPLYVPNSKFTNITIENPSRMSNRRIFETIGVRYEDIPAVSRILQETREMLANHEAIDTSRTLMVNLDHYGASSVDFFIYTFTKTTKWEAFHEIKEDILLRVSEIVAKHGAEIAFPTRTVHLASALEPED